MLFRSGYRVRTIQVVDRVEAEMVAALRWALEQRPAFVIMTGGLGPNWDDNTRGCLAKAANLPLTQDLQALEQIKSAYRRMNAKGIIAEVELTEARAGMANVPKGSICYENTVGTAIAVIMPMIAITTSSSTSVKPRRRRRVPCPASSVCVRIGSLLTTGPGSV